MKGAGVAVGPMDAPLERHRQLVFRGRPAHGGRKGRQAREVGGARIERVRGGHHRPQACAEVV